MPQVPRRAAQQVGVEGHDDLRLRQVMDPFGRTTCGSIVDVPACARIARQEGVALSRESGRTEGSGDDAQAIASGGEAGPKCRRLAFEICPARWCIEKPGCLRPGGIPQVEYRCLHPRVASAEAG